jgi:hypothetical protein
MAGHRDGNGGLRPGTPQYLRLRLRNAKLTRLHQRLLEDSSNILNHCWLFGLFKTAMHRCSRENDVKWMRCVATLAGGFEARMPGTPSMPTEEENTREL